MKLDISVEQSSVILPEFIQEMDDIKFALDNLDWKLGPQQLEHLRLASGKIQEAIKILSSCQLTM